MLSDEITTFDPKTAYTKLNRIINSTQIRDYRKIAKQLKVPQGYGQKRDQIAKRMIERRKSEDDEFSEAGNLKQRLNNYKLQKALETIESRELTAPAGWPESEQCVPRIMHNSPSRNMWLIGDDYWYEYSRRHGSHFQKARYLVGQEDGQDWAIRVPGTCQTVEAALNWSIPAAVTKAQEAGYPTKRQGDIYFVGKKRGKTDLDELRGTRHEARERQDGGWTIVHPQHKAVRLSGKYNWRAYQCRQDSGENGGGSD